MFKKRPKTTAELAPSILRRWAKATSHSDKVECAFTVGGVQIPNYSIGSADGLMPLVLWHAESIYRFAMGGRSLGVAFKSNRKSLLGYEVDLRAVEKPVSEVMCFLVEAITDIQKNAPRASRYAGAAEVEDLIGRFKQDMAVARANSVGARGDGKRLESAPSVA